MSSTLSVEPSGYACTVQATSMRWPKQEASTLSTSTGFKIGEHSTSTVSPADELWRFRQAVDLDALGRFLEGPEELDRALFAQHGAASGQETPRCSRQDYACSPRFLLVGASPVQNLLIFKGLVQSLLAVEGSMSQLAVTSSYLCVMLFSAATLTGA